MHALPLVQLLRTANDAPLWLDDEVVPPPGYEPKREKLGLLPDFMVSA